MSETELFEFGLLMTLLRIRQNTNTLFGLLFKLNRIQIEYSVQPYYV